MTAWERANRPKPPRINTREMYAYAHIHKTLHVRYHPFFNVWDVWDGYHIEAESPTHAEAIQYAHKLAYERSTK